MLQMLFYIFISLITKVPLILFTKFQQNIPSHSGEMDSLYIACNYRNVFFTPDAVRNYNLWSCQKVCEALTFLLDSIYIRFGSKFYRQIVGIPMGSNSAPLVADLFLFCYETDFMLFQRITNLLLLKLSILLLGIWMTY